MSLPAFPLSFRRKVLIPVILLLTILSAITVWIVRRAHHDQLRRDSSQKLAIADAVFRHSLELRGRSWLARCRGMLNEPRFRAVATAADPRALSDQLEERLEEMGGEAELMLFVRPDGSIMAGARHRMAVDLEAFAAGASDGLQVARRGQSDVRFAVFGQHVHHLVCVPLVVGDSFAGALAVAVPIREAALKELTALTRDEIAIFARGRMAAATLGGGSWQTALAPLANEAGRGSVGREVEVQGSHYLGRSQAFPGLPGSVASYVVLSSYEEQLLSMRQTQSWVWVCSLFGLLVSTLVISLIIGRITRPLHQLQEMVEAVGHGDFTQRVRVNTSDEISQLAHAFNHMIRNLQASREELQKTLETLRNTQAQLIQSEKLSAVGEFVAGVAHELNNPLTSLIGFAELLKQAQFEAKYQSFVNYIVKSSQRCHKIVQGLLSFARQHPPERKRLSLNEVVQTVLELLAYELRTSNIGVELALDPKLPEVMGDTHQLQQVFLNIVNNSRQALEADSSGGVIRIASGVNGGMVRLEFVDNGPGIPKDHLSKIFDPFFTTKPVGKGTGLGLSLCYGIVKEHGGSIIAESPPGLGAKFTVEIPVAAAGRGGRDAEYAPAKPSTSEGVGRRVLVIDDEEWILELVTQILQRDGYEVHSAQDGDAALHRVREREYELLVCDWKMPGLSGPQLYEQLTAVSPASADRVIFMTGDVVGDQFQSFLRAHRKACLSKPFSVQDFRNVVHDFFAQN